LNKDLRFFLKGKKAILFTIMTLLLLLSVFTFTQAYLDRNKELQNTVSLSGAGGKLRYIEDDVISNAYGDLLGIKFGNITRGDYINISFNLASLVHGRKYLDVTNSYESFVEGAYSYLNNANVTLIGFNNSFVIEPYGTRFDLQGQNISVYTMPVPLNYIRAITVRTDVGAENNSECFVPADDGVPYPEIIVGYTYDLIGGGRGECLNYAQLNPQENNDLSMKQFYLETKNPSGFIGVKYGKISSTDGVLAIITYNITANVTQLDLQYNLIEGKVQIKGGNISIKSLVGDITKQNEIILAEE